MSRHSEIELFTAFDRRLLLGLNGSLYIVTQDEVNNKYVTIRCPTPVESGQVINAVSTVTSESNLLICVVTDRKHVAVLSRTIQGLDEDIKNNKNQSNFEQLCTHIVPKRPTNILFSPNNDSILLSDAFGDVYKLNTKQEEKERCENSKWCEDFLLFGHFSSVTDLKLSNNSKIISGDRDSRIRISNFPHCYLIDSFCLGHSDVITSLLPLSNNLLLSGCADGILKLWNMDQGNCVTTIDVKGHTKDLMVDNSNELVVITSLHKHPVVNDAALFSVAGCRALYCLTGLSDQNKILQFEVKVICSFDGFINGLSTESQRIWVSVNCSGSGKLFQLPMNSVDIAKSERQVVNLNNSHIENNSSGTNGGVHESTVVSNNSNSKDIGMNDEGGKDGGDSNIGRFEWLTRQRKKEMVTDWKGKKRRHVEV